MKTAILIILLCSFHFISSIPEEWKLYIQTLIKRHSDCPEFGLSVSAIIAPPAPELLLHKGLSSFILPHVILWDPLYQLPFYFPQGILCHSCSQPVNRILYWKWGQSDGLQPRVIHDVEHTVLVVSAVYCCVHEHTVVATDPNILNMLTFETLPFILLHRTGFTKAFVNSAIQLLWAGMTVVKVKQYILTSRRDYIANLYTRLQQILPEGTSLTLKSLEFELIQSPSPSNDVICKCFLAHFQEYKHTYNVHMQRLTAKECISFDHTFKVASNIGYQRPDKKWVTQYKSVFFVMNEIGQIIAWQLTQTTSIDEVELLLTNLASRLGIAERASKFLVYVDNCCSLRDKLTGALGSNILVKLDLFHAIQRITKSIPKRHPFFFKCMDDLKIAFRTSLDLGEVRKLPTPESDMIAKNLDNFVKKWETCTYENWNLITEATRKEIQALKRHVAKGCLSDIPRGGGTTRNEAFHRVLNAHFSKVSRIGIPFALALLTIIIYQYNCKIANQFEPLPLLKKQLSDQPQKELFGIVNKDDSACNCPDWIVGKLDKSCTMDSLSIIEHVDLSDEVCEIISPSDILTLFQSAINQAEIAGIIKKKTSNSPLLDPLLFPFMSSVSDVPLHASNSQSDVLSEHTKRLDNVTKAWNFERHPVVGDGNCFFTAMAFSLICNEQSIHQYESNFFSDKGLDTANQDTLAIKLRELTVDEWKRNKHLYQEFLTSGYVDTEADKFLESGVYSRELGDTMVLALSNALQLVIIVLSSIKDHPIINILPRQVITPIPIFLAYNQYGPGHYDGLIANLDNAKPSISQSTESAVSHCSCGKNDKKSNTHCHPKVQKYTSVCFCPCFTNGVSCSDHCRCKCCNNPLGKRSNEKEHPPPRKRPRHRWQITLQSSAEFARCAGEKINPGSRTLLEFFALENILHYCIKHNIPTIATNIAIIYNAMAELVTSEHTLPFGKKSVDDISKFLKEHEHLLDLYTALSITTLKVNIP